METIIIGVMSYFINSESGSLLFTDGDLKVSGAMLIILAILLYTRRESVKRNKRMDVFFESVESMETVGKVEKIRESIQAQTKESGQIADVVYKTASDVAEVKGMVVATGLSRNRNVK